MNHLHQIPLVSIHSKIFKFYFNKNKKLRKNKILYEFNIYNIYYLTFSLSHSSFHLLFHLYNFIIIPIFLEELIIGILLPKISIVGVKNNWANRTFPTICSSQNQHFFQLLLSFFLILNVFTINLHSFFFYFFFYFQFFFNSFIF